MHGNEPEKIKLYIFTDQCPYGRGDNTFILPELEVLKEIFDIVLISAATKSDVSEGKLPTQCEGIKILRFCPGEQRGMAFYRFFLLFWLNKVCLLEVKEIAKTHKKFFLRVWKSMHFYARAESLYCWLKRENIIGQEKGIYYSYWYNERVLAMTMHRGQHPNLKIITRAHGYDLFDERQETTLRQPFKSIMDDKVDKVIFISDYNHNYYVSKMAKRDSSKYFVYKIGALKAETFPGSISRREVFRVVSCSNLIKLKRVTLIVDALNLISDVKIEWIHFGSGSEETQTREYAKRLRVKDNINYSFKGYVPREVIYEYYQTTYVHCFINVSETEGSPVSIQEALAFGIPIIGTDVGGVSEMIKGNGCLLKRDCTPEDIAHKIKMLAELDDTAYEEMRRISFGIWKNDYNQIENAMKFRDFLLTI